MSDPTTTDDQGHLTSEATAMLCLSPLHGAWRASRVVGAIGAVVSLIFGAAGSWQWLSPSRDMPAGSMAPKLIVAGSLLGLALCVALPSLMRARALERGRVRYEEDERFLAALPFSVMGYFTVVGRQDWVRSSGTAGSSMTSHSDASYYDIEVRLLHTQARPPEDVVRGLLASIGEPLSGASWDRSDGTLTLSGKGEGASVATQLMIVLRDLLVPLHRQFPLGSVRFSVDGR